jgi:hypothetical protein
VGPIALFDKSFIQSLSVNESVFFDHFFLSVICPIFYVETLADLKKSVRPGRTPEKEVGIIADKVPEMGGYPCSYHVDLGAANLFGTNIPMDGRIPTDHGRPVKVDGKVGFAHHEAPEAEAFRRWQNREFLHVERQFAQIWRRALNAVDLGTIAKNIQAMGVTAKTCVSLQDAKRLADEIVDKNGTPVVDQIKFALTMCAISPKYDLWIFGRWVRAGRPSFRRFAPYASHIISVETFFQITLGAGLIGTADANNRTDVGYLHYAPFCHVFVSSDNLHRRCAPCFMRPDQSFVWGPDLKADLSRLMSLYSTHSEEEKEQGLMRLAPTPPPEDNGLIVQLWDRHLIKSWRKDLAGRGRARATEEEDKKIVEHINRVTDAEALPADEIDFEPTAAEFVQLTRRVSPRKGGW